MRPAVLASNSGAWSTPHCCPCCRTPLLIISRRLPYMPFTTGFAIVAPVWIILTPDTCESISAKVPPKFLEISAAPRVRNTAFCVCITRCPFTTASLSWLLINLICTRNGWWWRTSSTATAKGEYPTARSSKLSPLSWEDAMCNVPSLAVGAMSLCRATLTPITGTPFSASKTMMRKKLEFWANVGNAADSRHSTTIDHKAKFVEKNRFIEKY